MLKYILLISSSLLICTTCNNSVEPKDCDGTTNGSAYIDDCGVCVGGTSGLLENYLMDCAGVCGGTAYEDECSTCDDNADNDCQQDCAGTWGGSAIVDDCGVCSGDDTGHESNSDMDCAQVCFGIHVVDDCSECVLPEDYNISMDCFGICFGTAFENECGCVEGNTGTDWDWCYGCTDMLANNFDPSALVNDQSCEYSCTDIDGNSYETIVLGEQIWMAENLKVTHYNDGTPIPTGFTNSEWSNLDNENGAYTVYPWDDDSASQNTCNGDCSEVYSNLYNWYATADDRGICPEGWHTPTDEDWMELEMYLGMSYEDAHDSGWRGTDQGSQLAGNADLWNSGDLENDPAFGSSGFLALPGGNRDGDGGIYISMGDSGGFWSSTAGSSYHAWFWALGYSHSEVNRVNYYKRSGFSVRCLMD